LKAAAFDYARPRELPEALRMLAQAAGTAKALAGGQSLGPMLNLRLARPALLVDVTRLEELKGLSDGGDHWRIGGGVVHAALEDAAGKMPSAEIIPEVAQGIAYRSVRNRGTVGGSLAHADPAADWPLALAALDAGAEIAGPNGLRRLPVDGLIAGAFTTTLAEDELILAVRVPKLSAKARWGYWKFCRKPGEFPEASAACIFDPERGVARVIVGALDGPLLSIPQVANAVASTGALPPLRELDAALADCLPRLGATSRRLHAVAVQRALKRALGS
jgi:aerobic carbon-monoxide dehydrogenase medium subunit